MVDVGHTLILLFVIGTPAAGVAIVALRRLGAVHAAELCLKAGRHDDAQPRRPA